MKKISGCSSDGRLGFGQRSRRHRRLGVGLRRGDGIGWVIGAGVWAGIRRNVGIESGDSAELNLRVGHDVLYCFQTMEAEADRLVARRFPQLADEKASEPAAGRDIERWAANSEIGTAPSEEHPFRLRLRRPGWLEPGPSQWS